MANCPASETTVKTTVCQAIVANRLSLRIVT